MRRFGLSAVAAVLVAGCGGASELVEDPVVAGQPQPGGGEAGGGGGGSGGALGAPLEDGRFAVYDVLGDDRHLVVRGRGLAAAEASLYQEGAVVNLDVVDALEHQLRLLLPEVINPGEAILSVRTGGEEIQHPLLLLRGPRGEAGPVGPAGKQGYKGDAGETGPQGEVGPQGPRGMQGPAGAIGETGPQGPMGPAGPVGPKGDRGLTGTTGQRGAVGAAGPRGEPGLDAILARDLAYLGGSEVHLHSGWQQIGNSLPVTVTDPAALLIFSDVGSTWRNSAFGATERVGPDVEFKVSVQGIDVGGPAAVPAGTRYSSFNVRTVSTVGVHHVRLLAKCASGVGCGSVKPNDQKLLILQINR